MARRMLALVVCTALSYPLGLLLGHPWILPSLNALPAYVFMVARLEGGDRRGAAVGVLAWALTLAVCGTTAFSQWPTRPDATVLSGAAYRDEMFAWICTGIGREGDPRLFLPQHLGHLVAFVLLSLLTASSLSILAGAVLMNYMSFYVASLARAGVAPWAVMLFGWQPWAICRVGAFCILGVVLAEPALRRLTRALRPVAGSPRPWLLMAGAGILADWLLKAVLAPYWARMLREQLCP